MAISNRWAVGGVAAMALISTASPALAGPGDRSADGAWVSLAAVPPEHARREGWVRPRAFAPFRLDAPALRAALAGAPMEGTPEAIQRPLLLDIPMPDGGYAAFAVVEAPVMHPDLQAKYPDIRTYRGQGVDDPLATLRMDLTPQGYHAQVLTPEGWFCVDPYTRGDTEIYAAYDSRFSRLAGARWECLTEGGPAIDPVRALRERAQNGGPDNPPGDQRRIYRVAIGTTGEYTEFHCAPNPPTKPPALAAVITAVNRATQVYEVEFAIAFMVVPTNDKIIYTDRFTDPYTNANLSAMLSQNQTVCDREIGLINYDLGHVFGTAGGGLARLGCVCQGGTEAMAASSHPEPIGDPLVVSIFCHEMGHQFNANHSFNGLEGSCGGNWSSAAPYEPGSGSTIMSYAGLCMADDLQPDSDPYFSSGSFDEIYEYVTRPFGGGGCAITAPTGNQAPVVNAGADRVIPRETPFRLTAQATDGNGDPLVFTWEQRDLGPQASLAEGDTGAGPIFRSWLSTSSATRVLPRLSNLLAGLPPPPGETLPTTNRTLTFRATARDNRSGGGAQGFDEMRIQVVRDAGPFKVTHPNTPVNWAGNTDQTVQWDVANTNMPPVNTSLVRLTLSTDGGLTYPHVLLANTPNDGSQRVRIPATLTTTARVRVEAIGSLYFDISDRNFTIGCYPDCDGTTGPGNLDIFDFLCFLNRYNNSEPFACDCDLSTGASVCDVFDFICFQNLYAEGCAR